MSTVQITVLILLGVALCVQLWARFVGNKKVHIVSKPLLVPLIMLYYCVTLPVAAYNWLILSALFLGWLGDVLRIFDSTRRFGFFPFVSGHFVYIVAYLLDAGGPAGVPVFSWLLLLVAFGYTVFYNTKLLPANFPKSRRVYTVVYVTAVTSMMMLSTARWGHVPAASFWLVLLGAFLFWFSDQFLIWGTGGDSGKDRVKHVHVYVMTAYTLGQFFIALGYTL